MKIWKIYGIKWGGEVIYVGQTGDSVDARFFKHLHAAKGTYDGSRCPKLFEHMRAHEFVGYTFELLECVLKERRYEREKYWVDLLKTQRKCNTTAGGASADGSQHYLYGKEVAKHIVAASVAARKGKPLSAEHKAKIALANRTTEHKNRRAVLRDDGVKFESTNDAGRAMGISHSAIIHAIKNSRKSAGHYWKYFDQS